VALTASDTTIANLALSHVGVGKEIAALETENSNEANACRRYFVPSRQLTLRAFAWPFAMNQAALTLVEENPTTEWAFSYVYPADCLRDIRILSGVRNDTRQSRVPYKVINDQVNSRLLIYSDMEDAILEYTVDVVNSALFPADFMMAHSYRLGYLIAPRLTKGDPFKLGQSCMNMFAETISSARANALNEEQAEEEVDSEFIRGRD
jgi:hypothetical protein